MDVLAIVKERGITEVLHFTTNLGLIGMLATEQGILSRQRLPQEKYLEYVYTPNASTRKDTAHLDYVNLSVSRINTEFFDHSTGWKQGTDTWWCVVSLDPAILDHDGVIFTTTNNIYSGVHRAEGPAGLEAMFADHIVRFIGRIPASLQATATVDRPKDLATNLTTCHQAEVLYPEFVRREYFRRIYVATGEHSDIVEGHLSVFWGAGSQALQLSPAPEVIISPEVFG